MCIGSRNGGGISLSVTWFDSVWDGVENWEYLFAPNCHSGAPPELHVYSDFQGQICACGSDELMFAWALKSGHRKLCGCWWNRSLLPFECEALCGRAAGLGVNRPCWDDANHGLVLPYSYLANVCPAFCLPRTLMASTHVNHNIYITEVKTGKCVHSLVGHRRTPWCVTFHPTIPGLIASGCLDGEVRIWDLHVSPSWNICAFGGWWLFFGLSSLQVLPDKRKLFGSFAGICL